jgi:ABC-type lipoprotein export system ATPase subunit
MLTLTDISKSFPQRGTVLDCLNLTVNKGDSLAITGPSGSGKTTLLNIIGTLESPDSGDVVFQGKSLPGLNPDESAFYRNRNIGFVFQDHLLLPYLTIRENIMLPLFASEISPAEYSEKAEYIKVLIDKTGIGSIIDKYPYHISGGEAQRATLVRALANKPSLLLADEPTGSLDTRNAILLGDLLADLNNEFGITLIAATHSEMLASKMKFHLKLENGKLNK